MSRKKGRSTPVETVETPEGNGVLTEVAESSKPQRKPRSRRVGGYRCWGRKGGSGPLEIIKTTATVGKMRKWYKDCAELIQSAYVETTYERYTVLDHNLQPIVSD